MFKKPKRSKNFYELLQVGPKAETTVIRNAYRYLAAKYHPDNGITGNAEMFRELTDAWRVLSDENKRAEYDLSIGIQSLELPECKEPLVRTVLGMGPDERRSEVGPRIIRDAKGWNEFELRLAILQILLYARVKKPKTGGATAKMIMSVLDIELDDVDDALHFLLKANYLELGERVFMITADGITELCKHLHSQLPPHCADLLEILAKHTPITLSELAELVQFSKDISVDGMEFALWYLREKGLLDLSEGGMISLNASGRACLKSLKNFPPEDPPDPPPPQALRRGPDDPNSPVPG